MRFKNVAISGDIGTGKSTLAKKLAEKLGWKHISGGDHIRKWYTENRVDLVETDKVPEEVDRRLEADFKKKMEGEGEVIFESRLAGWLGKDFEHTLKVLCVTDFGVAVKRVAKREGKGEEEARNEMELRARGLQEKFKRLYGVSDFLSEKYFDLVCDTTDNSPEECVEKVLGKLYGKID